MVQFCRPSSSTGWARTLFFRLTTQIDITEFNYLHLYSFLKLFLNVFFFILYVLHKHFAENTCTASEVSYISLIRQGVIELTPWFR